MAELRIIDTFYWRAGALHVLDQRLLPGDTSYIEANSVELICECIAGMAVRGAPAIGITAAYGVAIAALAAGDASADAMRESLVPVYAQLATTRPTAVNLRWAIEHMQGFAQASTASEGPALAAALLAEAERLHADDVAINKEIGRHGATLLPEKVRVLTHCNAGSLATAGYGTALGVIYAAVEAGKQVSVWADETRPYLQGARITAYELHSAGVDVTLISDNMAAYFMQQGQVDCIVVGADRVAANGDAANKIGTYNLAVLAKYHGIPFYVAAPTSTIDSRAQSGADIPIEERSAEEVCEFRGIRIAPEGVKARHPAFDVSPAELITALITERGVILTPDRQKIAAHLGAQRV